MDQPYPPPQGSMYPADTPPGLGSHHSYPYPSLVQLQNGINTRSAASQYALDEAQGRHPRDAFNASRFLHPQGASPAVLTQANLREFCCLRELHRLADHTQFDPTSRSGGSTHPDVFQNSNPNLVPFPSQLVRSSQQQHQYDHSRTQGNPASTLNPRFHPHPYPESSSSSQFANGSGFVEHRGSGFQGQAEVPSGLIRPLIHRGEFAGYMDKDRQAEEALNDDPRNLNKRFIPYTYVPDSVNNREDSGRGRGKGTRRGRGRGRGRRG